MNSAVDLNIRLHSLVIFKNVATHPVMVKLSELLSSCTSENTLMKVSAYSAFAAELLKHTDRFTHYILNKTLEDENIYMLSKAQNIPLSENIEYCLREELKIIGELASLSSAKIKAMMNYNGYLPAWRTEEVDFTREYFDRIENIETHGYGIFAKFKAFVLKDGVITPVKTPDATRLSQLNGYTMERQAVIDNTLALLRGKPAANCLLYGDAGTGKSSTVKAVANEYADSGLRLIEVTKKQLREIPALMDSLSKNPLKFIIFIDDLSFNKDDDDFGDLKAILEGSVSAKTGNLVIYATSNRRHLVKESFSDRDGDDIHVNDTREELASLSARFGLRITFSKPGKQLYLDIVRDLAGQYEMKFDDKDMIEAEAFAISHGGRSPRVARQFVEYKKSMEF